jgi:hypothetical protein
MAAITERLIGYSMPEEVILCFYGISSRETPTRRDEFTEPLKPERRKRNKATTNRRLRR